MYKKRGEFLLGHSLEALSETDLISYYSAEVWNSATKHYAVSIFAQISMIQGALRSQKYVNCIQVRHRCPKGLQRLLFFIKLLLKSIVLLAVQNKFRARPAR